MLLWADGFEHYGTSTAKMLDGAYANSTTTLDTTLSQNGTTSYKIDSGEGTFNNYDSGLRKVLPASVTKMGVGMHVYVPILPSYNYGTSFCDFISATGSRNSQVSCSIDNTGAIRFVRGSVYNPNNTVTGTLIATSTPIVTAAAWNHIEIQVSIHATLGWVRVAVNGIHKFEATGLNTLADAGQIASIYHHATGDAGSPIRTFNIDNIIYYDFNGTAAVETDFCPTVDGAGKATNYIGELQCTYLPPNGNTAQDTWAKSTGTSAFAVISETTPNDADYIFASTLSDLTEVALADLPTQITYVRGVMVLGRMAKSDAGAAQTQFGLKSAAAITDATSRPITTVPTYWWDFINVDPNTSVRWTRASLNAALLRLKRSL